MINASLKEIKNELKILQPDQLIELCLHLTKYKKENKELLAYLLFESHDEELYVRNVKLLIDKEFELVSKSNLFHAKKTVRKILRITNKYIKYSKLKTTEAELLIYFCKKLKKTGIPLHSTTAIGSLYFRQMLKIQKTIAALHEDLQYDFLQEINETL